MASEKSLLDLPDDIILMILSNTSSLDIINVSFTCSRLSRVSRDHTLWIFADFGQRPLSIIQCKLAVDFLCLRTKLLTLRAKTEPEQRVPRSLLRRIIVNSPKLKSLTLQNFVLDLTVLDFPHKLLRLSISGCHPQAMKKPVSKARKRAYVEMTQQQKRSYFFGVYAAMPRLQSLDLSRCCWMDNHSLLALSKCQHLRELNLNGCTKMGGCVAYSALAAGMGFIALERLDVRDTNMEDIDLKNFLSKPSLEQLFAGRNLNHPDIKVPLTLAEMEESDYPIEDETSSTPESSDVSTTEESDGDNDDDNDDGCDKQLKYAKYCNEEQTSSIMSETDSSASENRPEADLEKSAQEEKMSEPLKPSEFFKGGKRKVLAWCEKSADPCKDQEEAGPSGLNSGIEPEKTRQILAIVETIKRVDKSSNPHRRSDTYSSKKTCKRPVTVNPPDLQGDEALPGPSRGLGKESEPSDDDETDEVTTREKMLALTGRSWAAWRASQSEQQAASSGEAKQINFGGKHRANNNGADDFEEFLEEDGRNVIVLQCLDEGIHRTTHVYTKLDFPRCSKKCEPGSLVTDEVVRYPIQSSKLKVLALAGCINVTSEILVNLVRRDLSTLRVLDVRETGVTEAAVRNLQAYMGHHLVVYF